MSSDGIDGTSQCAGALLSKKSNVAKSVITRGLQSFDTARVLKSIGALIPKFNTGTNIQDIVVVRILDITQLHYQKVGTTF